jgi:hypothetical protein
MTRAITLKDITVYPVVEQQGPFFDVMEFFPTLTKELLNENRSWLEPTFIDPASGRLVLCVQSFVIKTPRHNILIDSCVGNHKLRPARPFWNMMNSDRFEKGLAAAGLTVPIPSFHVRLEGSKRSCGEHLQRTESDPGCSLYARRCGRGHRYSRCIQAPAGQQTE